LLLRLAYGCGLRLNEVLHLRVAVRRKGEEKMYQ